MNLLFRTKCPNSYYPSSLVPTYRMQTRANYTVYYSKHSEIVFHRIHNEFISWLVDKYFCETKRFCDR